MSTMVPMAPQWTCGGLYRSMKLTVVPTRKTMRPPLGQRLFFLHVGRTPDLQQAILQHASPATNAYPASEANGVISNFMTLSPADKQAILDFLRSL
jgi:hypothetical protein